MRVLLASDAFPPKIDGVADLSRILCAELTRRGHEVSAVAPAPGGASLLGCPVVRLRSFPMPWYPEAPVAYWLRPARAHVRAWRPDVAVLLSPGPAGLAVKCALPASTPLFHIYTTDLPAYMRTYRLGWFVPLADRLIRSVSNRAQRTLCPTELVRADLERRGYPRVTVWSRGVDAALFSPARRTAAMRERLSGGDAEAPIVLYVGRVAKEKRLSELVEVAARVPGARFAIVGDGAYRAELQRAFPDAVFTGYLRGEELAEAFASADLFAFPSDTDTFGQVVLQAMAAGLPPIVVEGSAPASFVPAPDVGLHVAARDPAAFASAVHSLVADPERRDAMRAAARRHALRFTWAELIDQLEVYFREAVAGAPTEADG